MGPTIKSYSLSSHPAQREISQIISREQLAKLLYPSSPSPPPGSRFVSPPASSGRSVAPSSDLGVPASPDQGAAARDGFCSVRSTSPAGGGQRSATSSQRTSPLHSRLHRAQGISGHNKHTDSFVWISCPPLRRSSPTTAPLRSGRGLHRPCVQPQHHSI